MKSLLRKPQNISKSTANDQTYQAHFNTYGEIELCEIDRETGLALVLTARFANVGQFRRWQAANKVSDSRIIWGADNVNATQVWTRRHGFGQDY